MATCIDCIHNDCCFTFSCGVPRSQSMGNKADTKCGLFKPTADVAEVVRCKDCEQFVEYEVDGVEKANGECFLRKMYSINRQFCSVKYDDFCSCGERKTQKEV